MYRLPRPLPPFPDESLPGLVVRNADVHHFARPETLFGNLPLKRVPFEMICQQCPAEALGHSIYHLLGLDVAQSHRMTLWHGAKDLANLLGYEVHWEFVRPRRLQVCPACLDESLHHRAIWLLDAIPVCARHGTWLVDACPKCKRSLGWNGLGIHICKCGFDLRRAPRLPARDEGGIVGLAAVFAGRASAPAGLGFGRALEVALRLGLFQLGLERELNHSQRLAGFVRAHRGKLPEILKTGWEGLSDWPTGFHRCLDRVAALRPTGGPAGIQRSFRGLHGWFFRWAKAGWGKLLAEEFARYAAGNAAVATTRHALGAYGSSKATARQDMSFREAQELLRTSAATMQRILDRNPDMILRRASPGIPSLLKGAEVRRLRQSDRTLLTINGVQRLLGIGRPVFLNLQSMGLVRTVPETEYLLEHRAYRRTEVVALLERCLRDARPIPADVAAASSFVTLDGASRSWRTFYDIVGALNSGRLQAAGVDPAKRGLRSVFLTADDVDAVLPHVEALQTSTQLAARLGVKAGTLRAWRRLGCIQAVDVGLVARKEGVFYSPAAVEAFLEEYVSSTEMGRMCHRGAPAGLAAARDLVAIGIRAVSGPGVDEAGTYLFRRAEVTPLVMERASASRTKAAVVVQKVAGRRRVECALGCVAALWDAEGIRRRNTLVFPGLGRVVHAIAGTRVTITGRFNFHLDPVAYAKLVGAEDAWVAFVPSEGERFLLVPFQEVEWPGHHGQAEGKVKWIGMKLMPSVEERWADYALPLLLE